MTDLFMISGKRIFAIVPAYNEEKHVKEVVNGAKKHVDGIIVVDDASSDKTYNVVTRGGIVAVKHVKNRGVGGAIKTGYLQAVRRGADIMVVLAGDNQMDPKEIGALCKPIAKGETHFVKGNRFRIHNPLKAGMPIKRVIGSKLLYLLTLIFTGYRLHDPACGYVAISKNLVDRINWSHVKDRYGFELSMIMNLSLMKEPIKEVDVTPIYGDEISRLKISTFIPTVAVTFAKGTLERFGFKFRKV